MTISGLQANWTLIVLLLDNTMVTNSRKLEAGSLQKKRMKQIQGGRLGMEQGWRKMVAALDITTEFVKAKLLLLQLIRYSGSWPVNCLFVAPFKDQNFTDWLLKLMKGSILAR
ncbi:hypothetical protein HAX54_041493 [Datura stramonium]|uniref:Uncharacterized protein n=1 Tax=Datura stramonium TaxID=4076 RepID=A0ABS8VQW5_DATST|nr:hypothetical protein [Datura stramonium]